MIFFNTNAVTWSKGWPPWNLSRPSRSTKLYKSRDARGAVWPRPQSCKGSNWRIAAWGKTS